MYQGHQFLPRLGEQWNHLKERENEKTSNPPYGKENEEAKEGTESNRANCAPLTNKGPVVSGKPSHKDEGNPQDQVEAEQGRVAEPLVCHSVRLR